MTENENMAGRSELVTNLVKSSIEQAQKSHLAYIEISEKIFVETGVQANASFNEKALELAKNDASKNLGHALKLLDVSNDEEALKLHDAHASAQSEEMARRVAELQAMAREEEGAQAASVPETAPAPAPAVDPAGSSTASQVGTAAMAAVAAAGAGAALAADNTPEEAPLPQDTAENTPFEGASEGEIEAEIEALAVKIHEVKKLEAASAGLAESDVEIITEAEGGEEFSMEEAAAPAPEAPAAAVEETVAPEVSEVVAETPTIADTPAVEPPVQTDPVEVPSAIRAIPEVSAEPPAMAATSAPEVAVDPAPAPAVDQPAADESESFDAELSARLDAVRAMLQGSSSS